MRFGREDICKTVIRWMMVAAMCASALPANAASGPKGGINLSGGEFNPAGSQRGVDYEYPSVAEISDTARAGFPIHTAAISCKASAWSCASAARGRPDRYAARIPPSSTPRRARASSSFSTCTTTVFLAKAN